MRFRQSLNLFGFKKTFLGYAFDSPAMNEIRLCISTVQEIRRFPLSLSEFKREKGKEFCSTTTVTTTTTATSTTTTTTTATTDNFVASFVGSSRLSKKGLKLFFGT
jgi:hypothetical protein